MNKPARAVFQIDDPKPTRFTPNHRLKINELVEALVEDGLISRADGDRARVEIKPQAGGAPRVDLHPLSILSGMKLTDQRDPRRTLSMEALTEWLAQAVGLPYFKVEPMKIKVGEVTETVGQAYAQRFKILPVEVGPDYVTLATSEPFLRDWERDLAHVLRGKEIRVVLSSPGDVSRFLVEFYNVARSVKKARDSRAESTDGRSKILNFEQLLEIGKIENIGADDQHIVHIVDWLLQYAFEQRASDIHLEPRREAGHVRFRIDGVMHKAFDMPPPVMLAVTSRIKILGRMDISEKRRPQDGRVKTRAPNGREVEMRLSTMPTAFGEKVVMRIFDPDVVANDFIKLGFNPREEEIWRDMINRPHGIVLVTGPTGSGKTTTLYSTLKLLATSDVNVCTIEDPIEMISPELNQMQVQPQLDLGFAEGVRTLLRQDPDIIMVGEIRDLETAEMAIQASLTGHLVLSTLHTNDATSAITRLLDLGVPHYLLQSTLTGVMAQRLVRTLCRHCKEVTDQVDEDKWKALVWPWTVRPPKQIGRTVGCLECRNTGYLGRTGIYEMFKISPELRRMIQKDLDLTAFTQAAIREGLRPLRLAAAQHVAAGITTIEEVMGVLPPVDMIEAAVR
jgi:general secretion pathway protein E